MDSPVSTSQKDTFGRCCKQGLTNNANMCPIIHSNVVNDVCVLEALKSVGLKTTIRSFTQPAIRCNANFNEVVSSAQEALSDTLLAQTILQMLL